MKKILFSLFIAFSLIFIPVAKATEKLPEVTDHEKVKVYFFRSNNCGWCTQTLEYFAENYDTYKDYFDLIIYEVNGVSENGNLMVDLQEYFDVDGVGSIPYFVIGGNFDNLGYATTEIVEEALKQYQSDDYEDFVAEFIEKGDYNGLKTETLEEACAAKGIKYGANSKNTEDGKLSDLAIVAIIFTVVIVGFGALVLSSRQQKTK